MEKRNVRVYDKPNWLVNIEHRLGVSGNVLITHDEFYKLVDVYQEELKLVKSYISGLEAKGNSLAELEYDYECLEEDLAKSEKEIERLKLENEQFKKG